MEPSKSNDLKMFMNYRRMRHIKRCNNFPTVRPIDVAQHSFYVAMLAMAISDEYNTYVDVHNLELHPLDYENRLELINTEIVLRKALLHDSEESITSDIPWNVKHMSPEIHKVINDAIDKRIEVAYKGTSTMEIYHKLGKECKNGLEGKIVDLADTTELAIYCWEEIAMGNNYLRSMLDKCLRIMEGCTKDTIIIEASPLYSSIYNMLMSEDTSNTVAAMIDID